MKVRRRLLVGMSAAALAGVGAMGLASSAVSAETTTSNFAYTGVSQTYTVPADGSVCSVTLDVVGANGATVVSDDSVSAVSDPPGQGGTAQATFTVTPGDVLTVVVGGLGGAVDGENGGASAFGGGGVGGSTDWGQGGGGGGGGATTVSANGTTLLVAGGGGGPAPFFGDGGAGGNGGSAGGDGTQGGSGGQGGMGQGGTTAAGGGGGVAGGPNATVGTAGTAGVGGTGGNTTDNLSSGGGGGGGGYFGGGGGGGADDGGSGGGGGGGSGYAAPSGTGVTTSALVQDTSGNGVAEITPLAGSCAPVIRPIVIAPKFTG